MYSRILGLTISALILAYGTVGAFAQNQMTPQPDQQQMQSYPMDHEGAGTMEHGSMMRGGMMGHMMGHSMMGGGAMEPPFMMRMMFALMDADGDGTISLLEFQAAHERIFKAMDSNRETASLRWRRCKRSSMGPGDRFSARRSDQQAARRVG